MSHRDYAILEVFRTFAEAASDVLAMLDYHFALSSESFRDSLSFVLSTFDGEEALKEEKNRALRNPKNNGVMSSGRRRSEMLGELATCRSEMG